MRYDDLFHHMEWADAAVWRAVRETPPAASEEMRERLHHIHLVVPVWLDVCQGRAPRPRPLSDFETLDDLERWARPLYGQLREYAAGLGEAQLDEVLELPWREELAAKLGTVHPTRRRDALMQLILHSQHHRAQITTRLRQLGRTPPVVDYIFWVQAGRPAPGWVGA